MAFRCGRRTSGAHLQTLAAVAPSRPPERASPIAFAATGRRVGSSPGQRFVCHRLEIAARPRRRRPDAIAHLHHPAAPAQRPEEQNNCFRESAAATTTRLAGAARSVIGDSGCGVATSLRTRHSPLSALLRRTSQCRLGRSLQLKPAHSTTEFARRPRNSLTAAADDDGDKQIKQENCPQDATPPPP